MCTKSSQNEMDRVKRIWYLSPMRAVSQEEPSDRKPDPWPLWMAGHAQLKFVMTECSKTQIRLAGLKLWLMYETTWTYKMFVNLYPAATVM